MIEIDGGHFDVCLLKRRWGRFYDINKEYFCKTEILVHTLHLLHFSKNLYYYT